MSPWDLPRAATGVRHLVAAGVDRDIPAADCLAGSGLTPEQLADPAAEVAVWQELTVARNVVRLTGDDTGPVPGLGVELGRQLHATAYGVAGLAMMAGPTLRASFEFAERHVGLFASLTRSRVSRDGGLTCIEVDGRRLPDDVRRLLVERDVASVFTGAAEATAGRIRPHRIDLAFPPDGQEAVFAEASGVEPRYDADLTRVCFLDADLRQPLPQADEHAFALATRDCAEILAVRRGRSTVTSQVLGRLMYDDRTNGSLERVAAALLTTPRTLRRRLAEEGTTFRALVGQARMRNATDLLGNRKLSVERVAELLGYGDTAAFTHAFTRWTGMSPRAWRREKS